MSSASSATGGHVQMVAGGSTVGPQPQAYDPYAFAGDQYSAAEMQLNGPAGELDDDIVAGSDESTFSAFRWLLAWGVLVVVLTLLNRTRFGHVLIYYGLILMIVLLLVTSYGTYVWALAPFVGSASNKAKSVAGQATAATSAENTNAALGVSSATPTAFIIAQAQAAQASAGGYPVPTGTITSSRFTPTIGSIGLLPGQQ